MKSLPPGRGELSLLLTPTKPVPSRWCPDWSANELEKLRHDANEPLEFRQTLEDQIGGQLNADLVLAAMSEDRWTDEDAISQHGHTHCDAGDKASGLALVG